MSKAPFSSSSSESAHISWQGVVEGCGASPRRGGTHDATYTRARGHVPSQREQRSCPASYLQASSPIACSATNERQPDVASSASAAARVASRVPLLGLRDVEDHVASADGELGVGVVGLHLFLQLQLALVVLSAVAPCTQHTGTHSVSRCDRGAGQVSWTGNAAGAHAYWKLSVSWVSLIFGCLQSGTQNVTNRDSSRSAHFTIGFGMTRSLENDAGKGARSVSSPRCPAIPKSQSPMHVPLTHPDPDSVPKARRPPFLFWRGAG